ncbi:MAG: discoidin domain-containing protein, partial [Bacteroidetes bacterium]|nr:discoidin domain-containing protein [Bacteroidota bacterium]
EKKGDTPYVLRLRLNHLNGNSSTFSYAYSFENGEPILDITFSPKTYFDNSKWRIFSLSSEETGGGEPFGNGLANLIIDGKDTTYWHSCWTTCNVTHPHELVVDTQGSTDVKGFTFLQRNGSRKIKDIEILVSEDASTWETLGDFVLSNINTPQNLDLVEQIFFRYFKIRIKSAHDGEQFASLAEVRIY